mgnify:CR=1 FL=1
MVMLRLTASKVGEHHQRLEFWLAAAHEQVVRGLIRRDPFVEHAVHLLADRHVESKALANGMYRTGCDHAFDFLTDLPFGIVYIETAG